MSSSVSTPDFEFAARYYPEILDALKRRKRALMPDLSEEDPLDPAMQLLEAFALVGHLNNCRLDMAARELYLPTAKRRGCVNGLLRLIDEHLSAAVPATVDVLARLTRVFTADVAALVPARSKFATAAGEGTDPVVFESPASDTACARTDRLGYVLAQDASAGTYVAWVAGVAPWGVPPTAGDSLYFGHRDAMWLGMDIALATAAANLTAVWEYSGHSEAAPTGVAWATPNLTFDLTSLLGAASRAGAAVTVRCTITGEEQAFASTWGGGINRIVTTNTLGQGASPSTTAADYIVSVEWTEIATTGGNDNLDSIVNDDIEWALPQSATECWERAAVNGSEAYWLRWRVVSVGGGPVQPVLAALPVTSGYDWWVLVPATQGETVSDTLGTSDGTANQTMTLHRSPYIEGTLTGLTVGSSADWVVTEEPAAFFGATTTEQIAFLDVEQDATYRVRFGDGTHGAVPGAGAVVVGVYRISADDDGNVGAGAVTRNSSGVAYLTDVTNPRRAAGWAAPEGSTEATLEAVKLSKPGALRAMNRAVTPGDCVALVLDAFLTSDGARPIVRAWATEEEYGVKTVGLHVVGAGGGALSATVLGQVDDFFNGADGDENDPDRRLVANHRVMSSNYVERTVGGALTVTIAGSVLGVESAVQAILTDLLDPLARESDGTWEWEPGGGTAKGRVSPTKVAGAVWRDLAVGNLRDVEVTDVGGGGPVSLVLAANELPVKGAWVVTVVQV